MVDGSSMNYRPLDLTASERLSRSSFPLLEGLACRLERELRNLIIQELGSAGAEAKWKISAQKFRDITPKLPSGSQFHLYRLPPLSGTSILVIYPDFREQIINCSLGGKSGGRSLSKTKSAIQGENKNKSKRATSTAHLSQFEQRILGKFALKVIERFEAVFSNELPLTTRYLQAEYNPLTLQVINPTELCYRIEYFSPESDSLPTNATANLEFITPTITFAPYREKLSKGSYLLTEAHDAQTATRTREAIENTILKTSIELRAVLGTAKVKYRDLMTLKAGDIIPLNGKPNSIELQVEGLPRFEATLGTQSGHQAVVISRRKADFK